MQVILHDMAVPLLLVGRIPHGKAAVVNLQSKLSVTYKQISGFTQHPDQAAHT